MKNSLLLLICVMFSLGGVIYASNQDLDSIIWLEPNDEFYIETKDNALFYKLGEKDLNSIKKYTNDGSIIRTAIFLENYKEKRLRKPTKVKAVGYQNSKIQFHFDTYVIEYERELYYLPMEFVASNSQLEAANKALDQKRSMLIQKKDSINIEIHRTQAEIEAYGVLSNKNLTDYSLRQRALINQIDSVEIQAVSNLKANNELNYNKSHNLWYNSLPNSTRQAVRTIKIKNAYLSSPNSAGGCDYNFYYTNKSNKAIKYLNWDGWVYNAVGDMVSCEIRGSSYIGGRDTGPVEPNNEYSAGGCWGNVIYNYSADRVELSSIDIIFMDGSRTSISKSDIKRMLGEPKKSSIGWSDENTVKETASLPYREELEKCKDSIAYWKKRVDILNQTSNLSNIKYSTRQLSQLPDCNMLSIKLQRLKNDYETQCVLLENFERKNFLNSSYNQYTTNQTIIKQEEYEYETKLIKRISVGVGADWLMSGDYMGASFPLEVVFGDINQSLNFSISGSYTTLGNSSNISINQLSSFATLYYNIGKSNHFCFPLSFGVGYNKNLGDETYDITGEYYDDSDESYGSTFFSAPLKMNKSNISSIISIGMRGIHWMFSLYARFDLTPLYDKSEITSIIPDDEYIYYDDIFIEDVIEASDKMSLFGMSLKYFF